MASKSKEELLIRIGADLKELEKDLKKGQKETKTFGQKFGGHLKSAGQVGGVAFAGLTALAAKSLDTFKDFETGLVAVAKTTDLQADEMKILRGEIVGLSKEIPVSANALLNYAAVAGQLGVKGTDDLLNFTETIAKLGVATDIVGEDGAAAIAKILNVTGEGVADIDKFGAVLVDLGNNFATTESKIVRTASEVGRATAQFDIGSTNVAGLSAALSSLSIQAELGGSVVGKTFRTIDAEIRKGSGAAFEAIQELTGMAGPELEQTFGENATLVFQRFIEGLGEIAESGGSVSTELEKFGLKGDEVNKVLPVLALRSELVGEALKTAGTAAKEASALNEEAAQAFDTTASKLEIAANKINAAFVTLGEKIAPDIVAAVEDITVAVEENADTASAFVQLFAGLVKIASSSLVATQQFLKDNAAGTLTIIAAAKSQTEFLNKEYAKRTGNLKDFREKQAKIDNVYFKKEEKEEKKASEKIQKIDIEKKKAREKIQKATADQLAKIEAEKVKRIIELNENELRIIQLQRNGDTEETIAREQEKREVLEEINSLSNNILELENQSSLSLIERESLNHSRDLLAINREKFDKLERQQREFGDELVGIVQDTYDDIEELEPPDIGTTGGGSTTTGGKTTTPTPTPTDPVDTEPTDTSGQDTPAGGTVISVLAEKKIDDNTYLAKARAGSNCSGNEASRVDNLSRKFCVEGCRSDYGWDSLTLRTCRKKTTTATDDSNSTSTDDDTPASGASDPVEIIEDIGKALIPPILKIPGLFSSVSNPNNVAIPQEEPAQPTASSLPTDQTQQVGIDITLNDNAADVISAQQKENADLGIDQT